MKELVKQESGRTMVEMLGTLAIIGILSIGGVTGYGRAIVAHRANTAVETAQREAAIVAGDVATGQKVEPSNATVLRSPSGYEVAVRDVTGGTSDIVTTTPFFGVEVGGGNGQAVQRNVAKSIVERAVDDWTNIHGIGVISGEGANRMIKWLTSSGTGTNGFETEVPENTQTVIIIVVYATDLSPRTGDLLTEFNVTPIDDTNNCPVGSSKNGLGGETGVLDGEDMCKCANENEVYTPTNGCEDTTDYCPSGLEQDENGKCICTSYTENECGLGWYCDFKSSSCSNRGTGVCTQITGGTKINGHHAVRIAYGGSGLTWWEANSWCIGKGSAGSITPNTLQNEYGCSHQPNSSYGDCNWNKMREDGLASGWRFWTTEQYNNCYSYMMTLQNTSGYISLESNNMVGDALCE